TPLTLSKEDLDELRGLNDVLSLEEVADVYLPLSRLLGLHVLGSRSLRATTQRFLNDAPEHVPFLIGLAGSVAVGKSTTSRILGALLARWPDQPRVELGGTAGFLLPGAVRGARGLLLRKGFPESYDGAALVQFLDALKSGVTRVGVPVYSHQRYAIVPGA